MFGHFANDIHTLWQDGGIQKAFTLKSQFAIQDSAAHFFHKLDEVSQLDYMPTEMDILNCRYKTSGLQHIDFTYKKQPFHMIDVGGQRSERRQWIHAFDNVTALLFVISLNEYDEVLQEDKTTNRMHESLQLFREIINLKYFSQTPIIIFFNKEDLFNEKIQTVDLNVCFPEYKGGRDKDAAVQFITKKFAQADMNKDRYHFTFVTTATNTENVCAFVVVGTYL